MTGAGPPLAALRRITRRRPAPFDGERCEMCAEPVGAHQHVVDLRSRALMCTCRPCYLLFTDEHASLPYRAVPDRYLSFDGPAAGGRYWAELPIPVGLAFLFRNSIQDRMIACYPGPAGATESELPLESWARIVAHDPRLTTLRPDVEALLLRVRTAGDGTGSCHLVPIDACYELVGRLRTKWRGFDGGAEAHAVLTEFFDRVHARSRPAPR
jgi:hypothetical protein